TVHVGGNRNLQDRIVILGNSTLANGSFNFERTGSLTASNVTFGAQSMFIDKAPLTMILVNSTYNYNPSHDWSFGNNSLNGGLTIIGGNVKGDNFQLKMSQAGGPTKTTSLLID